MRSLTGSVIFVVILIMLDLYLYQAIKSVSHGLSSKMRLVIGLVFWSFTVLSVVSFLSLPHINLEQWPKPVRTYLFATLIGFFLAKLVAVPFFLVDDLRRLVQWGIGMLKAAPASGATVSDEGGNGITRSVFLSWLGLGTGTALFGTLLWGFKNQYNYQVRQVRLAFKNLPPAFKGLKLVHISDIHSGSFMDVEAVKRGVDLINAQNADLILFTGDLVNDKAEEMAPYVGVFSALKAPLGVYSTLGNHDYGDYVPWPDRNDAHRAQEKAQGRHLLTPLQQANLDAMKEVHKSMGWQLLNDTHAKIERNGEQIALMGVQNISGKARFHSYGNLQKALAGAEQLPFKILMSHDPSHWEKEVKGSTANIDLMLSGHTHGMQFGVELPWLKWSPVKWVYKQWAGLYEHEQQKLYVNRGFGFIGYPGRVGILPEITVIELA
ncbi:MAG: metallophosphoesterase [Bacteroidetes bacterium]|nr:MAG: metallophosphoesterase [Bacteroidota bacterium]